MLCYVMLCYFILYHTILYNTILILYYIVLYYIILCYVILCYILLCGSALGLRGVPFPTPRARGDLRHDSILCCYILQVITYSLLCCSVVI